MAVSANSFWNEKYQNSEYLYSSEPNVFLSKIVSSLSVGKALVPGDGDGRNGLSLARKGFSVDAFDFSEVAVQKANTSASQHNLKYRSEVLAAENFQACKETYDFVAIIFLHLPKDVMKTLLQKCTESLKADGTLLIQVFSQEQIALNSGGPKDINLLYKPDDFRWLEEHFKSLSIEQADCELSEGPLHTGKASVVNVIAKNRCV